MDVSQDILAPLTNCKGLKKLHIRSECGGEDDHTIVPQALYDFCQACRKLERLHLLFARDTKLGLTSAIFQHMVQFNPHLEALQISLPFDEVNSNDLATLAHGCRRLHTVGPYAVFNERILSTMPRGTAFHKVRNLICRDMKEADMSARSGTCTISKVRHCLDILQKRMPRLEYLWIPNWFDVVIDDLLLVDTIDIVMLSENVEGSDSPLDSIYGYQQMELDAPSVELKLKILDAR